MSTVSAYGRTSARTARGPLEAATAPLALRLEDAFEEPERAQAARLAAILRGVEGSRQAERFPGLARARRPREFQDAVPLRTADDFAADIEDLRHGAPAVLTRDPVIWFERTGGSSGASKFVPHTRALQREFHAALMPWLHDLAVSRPAACRGPAYWSISSMGDPSEVTPGGIPVGAEDDGAYFPRPMRALLARMFAVPGAVARLSDIESCRYVTLRCLIDCPDLALISVWNPSFLTLLMESLDADAERLLDDLAAGTCRPPHARGRDRDGHRGPIPSDRESRIREVVSSLGLRSRPERARSLREAIRSEGALTPGRLWPELALISLWTDAQAARSLPPARERFPGVELQGKGLLATEGVVTLPLFRAPAPVLAIRSHFYEFLDPTSPAARPRLAHELEAGRSYEVVMSTGGGLLRYRLGDRVSVEGFLGRTPCLRFAGRADTVSDLVGEKLSAGRVSAVLASALGTMDGAVEARFAMLAPEWTNPPAYHLYVESEASGERLEALARRVEDLLSEGFAYRYARELGQLGPVRVARVRGASRRYEMRCLSLGQRAGSVKPLDLHPEPGWGEWLADSAIEAHGVASHDRAGEPAASSRGGRE